MLSGNQVEKNCDSLEQYLELCLILHILELLFQYMLCMDIRAKTWSKQDRGGIFRSSLWQAGVFLSAICTQGFEALIDKVSFIDRVGSNMVKKQRGQTRRNPATQSYRAYIWQPVVNVILGSALWLVLGFLNQTARRASGLVQK